MTECCFRLFIQTPKLTGNGIEKPKLRFIAKACAAQSQCDKGLIERSAIDQRANPHNYDFIRKFGGSTCFIDQRYGLVRFTASYVN